MGDWKTAAQTRAHYRTVVRDELDADVAALASAANLRIERGMREAARAWLRANPWAQSINFTDAMGHMSWRINAQWQGDGTEGGPFFDDGDNVVYFDNTELVAAFDWYIEVMKLLPSIPGVEFTETRQED